MKRIFSMKNWDILTRNMPLAIVATFGSFVVSAFLADGFLQSMFVDIHMWGAFSLANIMRESTDSQRFPEFWQRIPNWASIMVIWIALLNIITFSVW